jgi:two-component system chemotaxis response regulator CheY
VGLDQNASKRGTGKKALVVDDNASIRKLVIEAFLSNGFDACAEAENGKEAIAAAKRTKPDVITLDLSMPVMNGLEAAPEMRKILPDTPIILFTMYGDGTLQAEASKAGITLVLPKTVSLTTLLDKAHEVMGI